MDKICLYGVNFKRQTRQETVQKLFSCLEEKGQTVVFTPNLQMLDGARKSKRLASLLNRGDMLLPDGIGVRLACRRHCISPPESLAGIDAAYSLLVYAAAHGYRVFLLGGEHGTALLAAKNLKRSLPTLDICGTYHGYFDKSRGSVQNTAVIKKINKAKPDILLVCFGFPKQEAWIIQNKSSLRTVRIFMGLGGSLDVWSGKIRRAPKIMRKMHLEWLWRCALEPSRIPRLIKSAACLLE